ncbi:hypothetical protein BH09ACT1_BH09ACT1_14810 [soil metagenome]
MATDLLGTELTVQEQKLLSIYTDLKDLLADETLAPMLRSALLVALSSTGVAVAGLGLAYEHLVDLGA